MTVRPPLSALLFALVLGLPVLALGCGGEERSREGLLSASRAEQLRSGLADVDEAVADGSCTRVREEIEGLENQLNSLPRNTDPELKARLEEGVDHLAEIAPAECEESKPRTTETQPETEPPAETVPPEETVPPVQTTPPAQTEPPAETQPPAEPEEPGNGNGNGPPDDITGQGPAGGEEAPE